jgi:NAD dependent epimerase/dehydratase
MRFRIRFVQTLRPTRKGASMTSLPDGRVLVTGADGFIGSHLVEHLLSQGYSVRGFVQYNAFGHNGWLDTSASHAKGKLDVHMGDIRDRANVQVAARDCRTILHLAALIGIPYSYQAPESYIDTNVKGTLNILEAARELDIERVLVTSTSEVYGSAQFVPITEDHPIVPQSPYAASKAAADHLALSYHLSFGMPVTVVRPFNTYGPRQSMRAVIPTVITQLARGDGKIELGALTPTRDFTFVNDTAAGILATGASDKAIGHITNIGSGFEISVGDAARVIAEVMGKQVEITQDPKRMRPEASEVDRLFADIGKAEGRLGWVPEHGGLEGFKRGIAKTVKWFADPENLARYPQGYQV